MEHRYNQEGSDNSDVGGEDGEGEDVGEEEEDDWADD